MFLKRQISFFTLFQSLFLIYSWPGLAETAPAAQAKTPTALEQFFPLILLGLVFYILLIRPQQRRHRQHGNFLSKIKRGDEVLTSSGIYGKIEGLTDSFVILEVAEDVCIRVAKSQIASYVDKTEKDGTKTTQKK